MGCVFTQWTSYMCLEFLSYAQMLMHAIAHGICTNAEQRLSLHWKF